MHALLETAVELQPVVRGFQDEIERERRIPAPLVDQLREAGFYRMTIPRSLGGGELDALTFLRAAELMAEADGSVGWNLGNNAVGQLIALSLPREGVDEIFGDGPDAIVAGTAVPGGGTGERVEGGYLVSGRWPFGSGCRESQWMVTNFDVTIDGETVLYRALLPTPEATILDNWDMSGMRGTGSHDWQIDHVFVPTRRTVRVAPGRLLVNQWQHWPGPLYQLPVHAIVGPHHSMAATGVARAGIDAFKELAGAKTPRGRTGLLREQERVQETVARAEAVLGAAQVFRAQVVGDLWATVAQGAPSTIEQRARCRMAASYAVDSARLAMDLVYRAGGTTSSQRAHQIARCWRDLHVIAQAASTAPDWYTLAGKVLLGLDPGGRLT
jgi:alkylation response protein AidB-like acyl-CoA dehydrogenase